MTFGTGVAQHLDPEPQTLHAAAAQLAQAYPDRVVLGLGGGYPEQAASTGRDFGRPLATGGDYRARMDNQTGAPLRTCAYPRIIARRTVRRCGAGR